MQHFRLFLIASLALGHGFFSHASTRVRVSGVANQEQFSIQNTTETEFLFLGEKILRKIPLYISEDAPPSRELYIEKVMRKDSLAGAGQRSEAAGPVADLFAGSEVRKLIEQGPKENRINLTILGDGYTETEREKFFSDATRIADGLFSGRTFSSFLPLFNVYAVFVPSAVSGLGDGAPVGTAFGLYRNPKGSKRAIYPGDNTKIDRALGLAPATDYPILMANDDFYGGLGGKYAITTRSEISGLVVLRHELGHNFGQVGEEYDNGFAYFGANNSSKSITWTHWLTGPLKYHDAVLVSGDYVWQNLSKGAYSAVFQVPNLIGGFFFGMISSVGWQTPQDVDVRLNGQLIGLQGTFNSDRNFYKLGPTSILSTGQNRLQIQENIRDGDNVLGFATLYAAPADYDFSSNTIAAFSTFDQMGNKSYRPTHQSCLMRDMAIDQFCSVDQENIWHQLLNRISLIDSLKVAPNKVVELSVPPLRGLKIRWFKPDGSEAIELRDLKSWSATSYASGNYGVEVVFESAEVRRYNANFKASAKVNL